MEKCPTCGMTGNHAHSNDPANVHGPTSAHTDNCSGQHDEVSGACIDLVERTILAHLNITLPIEDKRTEAEITAALEGIIEVGNDERWVSGTSRRYLDDITITLVEEI